MICESVEIQYYFAMDSSMKQPREGEEVEQEHEQKVKKKLKKNMKEK